MTASTPSVGNQLPLEDVSSAGELMDLDYPRNRELSKEPFWDEQERE